MSNAFSTSFAAPLSINGAVYSMKLASQGNVIALGIDNNPCSSWELDRFLLAGSLFLPLVCDFDQLNSLD
ncbi:hypothetical protein Q3G72_009927 [Acer saccharum]|nr:hypothetical protein Q3G72_009927 [Acer saccharum]